MTSDCTSWEFKETRFILCEGPHDKHFLETLGRVRKLPPFQIRDAYECCRIGGKDGFIPALKGFPVIHGFSELRGIAIVTDNDNERSLTNLQRGLEDIEEYVNTESPRIGKLSDVTVVIIPIPDYNRHGSLETLCLPTLYEKWPDAKKCVDAYLTCTGAINWQGHKLCKAEVRSIISGFYEDDPNKGLGYLFRDNRPLANHPCFNELADILNRFDEIIERGSF